MNKTIKISLLTIGGLLATIFVAALAIWWYLNTNFWNFEGGFRENKNIPMLTLDGVQFFDRNGNGALDVYEDHRHSDLDRVEDLLAQMTLEEKLHLLKGAGLESSTDLGSGGTAVPGAAGVIVPTPRLGIPTIYLADGPAGLRISPKREGEKRTFYATAFPIATLLASTWNAPLVERVGDAMGNEAAQYGVDVLLAPGVNIQRHPLNGRNYEYFSEDPVLSGEMGSAIVNGIESNGVGSSVKHFVANNQETNRAENNAIVTERALREIYLKSFELVVRNAEPWTIMTSYNKVNGIYTSESKRLLTDILRGEWGYTGVVMSDWFGGDDAVAQITAGNDLLEPGTKNQWDALADAADSGELSEAVIDTSVRRILQLIFRSPKMRGVSILNDPDLDAHARVTRESASEGMILLKNENVLPLKAESEIALFGVTSYEFIAGGTGSGDVNEAYTVSLADGLKNAGFKISVLAQEAYVEHREKNAEAFVKPQGVDAFTRQYLPPEMEVAADALETIANSADVGVVTIGRNSGEAGDRNEQDDFLLSDAEGALIAKVTSAFHAQKKPVIVVLNIGGVIETASWKAFPDAILLAWQGGQEGGNSVADILRGDVNPSGKLPMTFPMQLSDHASNENFPLDAKPADFNALIAPMLPASDEKPQEQRIRNVDFTEYEEGIFVGYRHFDHASLDVSFPFGFGMSFTQFSYETMSIVPEAGTLKVDVVVQNTGAISGKEAVQLYVSMPESKIERPIRELKGFAKTDLLQPGESTSLSIDLSISDLSYWDEVKSKWVLEPGRYVIELGASSRDIRLSETVVLGE